MLRYAGVNGDTGIRVGHNERPSPNSFSMLVLQCLKTRYTHTHTHVLPLLHWHHSSSSFRALRSRTFDSFSVARAAPREHLLRQKRASIVHTNDHAFGAQSSRFDRRAPRMSECWLPWRMKFTFYSAPRSADRTAKNRNRHREMSEAFLRIPNLLLLTPLCTAERPWASEEMIIFCGFNPATAVPLWCSFQAGVRSVAGSNWNWNSIYYFRCASWG